MKKIYITLIIVAVFAAIIAVFQFDILKTPKSAVVENQTSKKISGLQQDEESEEDEKSLEDRARFTEERYMHEFNMQKNPTTGTISKLEKETELQKAFQIRQQSITQPQVEAVNYAYTSRGPSNLGGRTRTIEIDQTDPSGNTILAGGVSGGVFRTTDGGANWTKVSPNSEIHNVTSITQDPRAGFQNIWYYATGEARGNSAGLGSFFLGQGIWQSTDSGLTWSQIPQTATGAFPDFDNILDLIYAIDVHPVTGDLFIASIGGISRFDGTALFDEIPTSGNSGNFTDITITPSGRAYAALNTNQPSSNGVWTLPNGSTGVSNWTQIAQAGSPTGWAPQGRIVIGSAPSNEDVLYALYVNGLGGVQADLWQWNQGTSSWINYSSKLPDEPGGDSPGNDPFTGQGGYDLVVEVKPDDENFVLIGGSNAYKIGDITSDATFLRIGGYNSNQGYALYDTAGGDTHHPDIHAFAFSNSDPNIMYSGTDGGVHRTDNINAVLINWVNINNNYQTYQYYHVAQDNATTDAVIGGAQDNGTTVGGIDIGLPDNTTMSSIFSGDGVAVAISNDNACLPFFFGSQNGNIIRDCPGSGVNITPAGSQSQFVTYFYLDPDNNNALYYAGANVLYRTDDSSGVTSGTWDNLGSVGQLGTVQGLTVFEASRGAYDPTTSFLLIGASAGIFSSSGGNIYRLSDPQNATTIAAATDITPPGLAQGSYISSIAVHPTDNSTALVTVANYGVTNIFLSTNVDSANPTWTEVERNLSDFSVRSATIAEDNGDVKYFVGTARGLYSSEDPTISDWTIEAPNQIGFAVVSALRYRSNDGKILIGTHGNGMWEATIDPTASVNDEEVFESSISIYPNPIENNRFSISSEELVGGSANISIYTLQGREVYATQAEPSSNGTYTVQLEQTVATGNYIVKIEQGNNSYSQQIIFK